MARYIHPEFGGFCLTTRFRRDIRLVAVSVLLGTMVGGKSRAPPRPCRRLTRVEAVVAVYGGI